MTELSRHMDRYLMFYAQSAAKGHIREIDTKCVPTTTTNYNSLFNIHYTVEDMKKYGENEVE